MATILSNHDLECVIDNSHRVVGYAAVDRPLEFSDVGERFTIQRSQNDGGLYAMAMMAVGGDFVIRLAPTSPSAGWLVDRGQEIKQALIDRRRVRIFNIRLPGLGSGEIQHA